MTQHHCDCGISYRAGAHSFAMKAFLFLSMFPLAVLLADQPSTKPSARVAFAQYCFWTGEMELGQIAGVLRTEAGYFQGREVTLVDYDPAQVSLESLVHRARQAGVRGAGRRGLGDGGLARPAGGEVARGV